MHNFIKTAKFLDNHISQKGTAEHSGYSLQYFRRLIRNNKIKSIKIGSLWLKEKNVFDFYFEQAQGTIDQSFDPK
jgi:hypothetical protein